MTKPHVAVDALIRSRRTVKSYAPGAIDRQVLDELLELARWAPNHKLTNPWRFRVVGPAALNKLKKAESDRCVASAPAGSDTKQIAAVAAAKLDRAPTLVVCSAVAPDDDRAVATENVHAAACAAYIVLLAAHARGLAGYWRTPAVLNTAAGRAAVELPDNEEFIGLLHLGRSADPAPPPAPERATVQTYVTYLE